MYQELIVLRAIRDANVPKFLMEDLKLFNGIVSDLFPKIRDVPVDYGEMELSIREKSIEHGLEDVEGLSSHLHSYIIMHAQYVCSFISVPVALVYALAFWICIHNYVCRPDMLAISLTIFLSLQAL